MSRTTQAFILFLTLLISVLIAWGMRFINEDLFVALCAGRDVVAGRLAEPDTWSYTTDGRVWVNQGWLSHLFLFGTYSALGNVGPVLTKGALLIACLSILFFRCRRMEVGVESTLLALTVGTLAIAPFLQIRAENFGLVCFLLMSTALTWRSERPWTTCISALAILWLWSNVHGSFVLAFPLLGLKLLVQALSYSNGMSDRIRSMLPWVVTLLLGVAVSALGNPFGTANLMMPLRQLSARSITDHSADWLPLLDWQSLSTTSRFSPLDPGPFILALFGLALLVIALALIVRVRQGSLTPLSDIVKNRRVDIPMEALIPVMMIPPTFLFRRILLFAGISIIPLLALAIQTFSKVTVGGGGGAKVVQSGCRVRFLPIAASVGVLACVGWIFYTKTVVPYLPWNPMIPSRPLIQQLTSFDFYPAKVIGFMKSNRIRGRLFTSWVVSDFLLFHVPDVKVFMDCRDQSAYSDSMIKTFFSILNTPGDDPKRVEESMKLLNAYDVSTIVLETSPRDLGLAVTLMETKKWGCIFYDEDTIVLARRDDPVIGPEISQGRLPRFTYPDAETRSITEAVLAYFMTGSISQANLNALKSIVKRCPDPNVYGIFFLAGRNKSGCLNRATKTFMLSELRRLNGINRIVPNRTAGILESIIRLAFLLESDIKKCAPSVKTAVFRALIEETEKKLLLMKRLYVGISRQ